MIATLPHKMTAVERGNMSDLSTVKFTNGLLMLGGTLNCETPKVKE